MRRLGLLGVLLLLTAGCSSSPPGEKVVTPTPSKVIGKVPTPTATPKGDPAAGKTLFVSQGCGGCHTFRPAGSTGKVGPDLDKLAQEAATANMGTEEEFVRQSIVDPEAYIAPGYQAGIMPATYSSLTPQQLSDLVAFLTQSH